MARSQPDQALRRRTSRRLGRTAPGSPDFGRPGAARHARDQLEWSGAELSRRHAAADACRRLACAADSVARWSRAVFNQFRVGGNRAPRVFADRHNERRVRQIGVARPAFRWQLSAARSYRQRERILRRLGDLSTRVGCAATGPPPRISNPIRTAAQHAPARVDTFQVDFIEAVNTYLLAERSAKHGALIIVLVFGAMFLFDVCAPGRVASAPRGARNSLGTALHLLLRPCAR